MRKPLFSALLFIIVTLTAAGQTLNKPKLDSLMNAVAAENQAMGSLAIAHNGTVVYQKAIGASTIIAGKETPATVKTRYRTGSISKMFTATMIIQLVEAGKLTLETKLSAYFPQIPDADNITIREMLSHRSGLYNFVRDSAYQTYMVKPHTQAEMLTLFAAQPSDFEPDSKAEYSNTNFVLLGYIVEKATSKTYGEALKQLITTKLGLVDTYYGGKINPAKNEAYSYVPTAGWQQMSETDMSITAGAGAVVSTPTDLVKFMDGLFAGRLVNADHLMLMKTINEGYGMGLFMLPFGPKKAFGHNGDIDGFSSVVGYFPEEKMAYAYCANGVDYGLKELVNGIERIYFNIPYKIPSFKVPVLSATDLDKYVGNYSSLRAPIKIVISKNGNTLMAQVTGQPAFALKPLDTDRFGFSLAGIVMEFRPLFKEFTLKQGANVIPFTKDDN